VEHLEVFAHRVYEVVGWHVEPYIDSRDLPDLAEILVQLPAVCIDHLGLSSAGLPHLLALVEKGVFVKATGFGRVDFDVTSAVQKIVDVNPAALVFGTDLPSTRAPRPYLDGDYFQLIEALGEDLARQVFYENGTKLYRA
jgi:predicted TIM-barrel fold metal-dependent hydrolase